MTEYALFEHEYVRGIYYGQQEVAVDSAVRIHFLLGTPVSQAAELIPCMASDRPQLIREAEENCVLHPLRWERKEEETLTWSQFVGSRIQSDEMVADLMSVPVFDWFVSRLQRSIKRQLSAIDHKLEKHHGSAKETLEAEELPLIQNHMLKYYSAVRRSYPELTLEQIASELVSGMIGYELNPELTSRDYEAFQHQREKAFAAGVRDGAYQMAQNITLRIVRKLGLSPAAASGLVDYKGVSRKALTLSAAQTYRPGNPVWDNHLAVEEYKIILNRNGMNDIACSMLTQTVAQCMICVVLGSCEMLMELVSEEALSADSLLRHVGDSDVARFIQHASELCYEQKRMRADELLKQVLGCVVGYNIQWYLKDQ